MFGRLISLAFEASLASAAFAGASQASGLSEYHLFHFAVLICSGRVESGNARRSLERAGWTDKEHAPLAKRFGILASKCCWGDETGQ
ncbi:hypothetical protein BJ741DRAFT_637422 [Chytriomyces cf. hyalinus JEL632]|nr:hypothetical protein BJ741DRAFT_637422 [Chytriomyces cf. hyalinus JEL632]